MDIEPLHRNTDLTAILERAIKHFWRRLLWIHVIQYNAGIIPASSNVIRLSRPAAPAITFAPVAVEPVNEIFRTSDAQSALPLSHSRR